MSAICGVSSLLITYYVEALDSEYADKGNFSQFMSHTVVLTPHPVIAVVGYGDETYVPLQSWNVRNCIVGAGLSCSEFCADYFTLTTATTNVFPFCQTTPTPHTIRISLNITKMSLRLFRVVYSRLVVTRIHSSDLGLSVLCCRQIDPRPLEMLNLYKVRLQSYMILPTTCCII